MKTRSKKYLQAVEKIDKSKFYASDEAIKLVKETNVARFDASVEVAIRLNLDTKKVDQQLRGTLVLPNGTGKIKKLLVLAKGDKATDARAAGADFVGDADMIAKIEKENWLDFDIIVATPDMMPALGKLGKLLGPKGLMPNPKTGTVTADVVKAITEIKKGRIEYRTDSFGIVHTIIGKVSFEEDKLLENLNAFIELILKSKPSTAKGIYVKSIAISSTMGPGIKISSNSFDK